MSSRKAPLVSVGLPVYNGARTIRRALDSLVAQDWPNIEIIICDDGSSDDTLQICQQYAKNHSLIHYEVNEENLGEAGMNNFRKTLSLAKGKYFFWASQDDIWHKNFIAKLVGALEADEKAVAAMGAVRHFVENKGQKWVLDCGLCAKNWPQSRSRLRNYFHFFQHFGHSEQLRANIVPELVFTLFIHGIVRTENFRDSFAGLSNKIIDMKPVVSQWVLSGNVIYVDEVLFFKEELTSFISSAHELSEVEPLLDSDNLTEFKRRKYGRNTVAVKSVSKHYYALATLKAHLGARKIPLYYKWACFLLVLKYLLTLYFKPLTRIFRPKVSNKKFNLLKTPPEKFKNLTQKSPLP